MIRIEPGGESRAFLCDHCHNLYGATRGYVYEEESAHAIYYAALHDCGAGNSVYLAVGIGEREADDELFGDARSVTFRVEPTETGVDIGVIDARHSPWSGARTLGHMMDADEALEHESFQELLHIAEHVIAADNIVSEYLAHGVPARDDAMSGSLN